MDRPERHDVANSRSELDFRCPMPLHGDCRPQCDLETDCVQTMCDRKGTAGSSATESISDARGPSRGGREQGRSVGAGACTRERSCLATLYTVTSIPASSDRSTGDCAIQKTHSGDAIALVRLFLLLPRRWRRWTDVLIMYASRTSSRPSMSILRKNSPPRTRRRRSTCCAQRPHPVRVARGQAKHAGDMSAAPGCGRFAHSTITQRPTPLTTNITVRILC